MAQRIGPTFQPMNYIPGEQLCVDHITDAVIKVSKQSCFWSFGDGRRKRWGNGVLHDGERMTTIDRRLEGRLGLYICMFGLESEVMQAT